jgi:hypothetical protein
MAGAALVDSRRLLDDGCSLNFATDVAQPISGAPEVIISPAPEFNLPKAYRDRAGARQLPGRY